MGNSQITPEQLEEMKQSFSTEDLKRLHRRFRKLDSQHAGSLGLQDFLDVPDLEHNPLVQRVVASFDTDHSGRVDFYEFISSMSVFTRMDCKQEKYQFTFKLYDVDQDGFISNADLFTVLKSMVGSNLTDIQLQQLVDRTILRGDLDHDGKLSYEEFVNLVQDTDLEHKLYISNAQDEEFAATINYNNQSDDD